MTELAQAIQDKRQELTWRKDREIERNMIGAILGAIMSGLMDGCPSDMEREYSA